MVGIGNEKSKSRKETGTKTYGTELKKKNVLQGKGGGQIRKEERSGIDLEENSLVGGDSGQALTRKREETARREKEREPWINLVGDS